MLLIVATGQYNVPYIPKIEGLDKTVQTHSEALEHVNAFRARDDYRGVGNCGSYS
jgi:cation diffusion facilitator CzcD-associated flavoprotein CzcO